MMRRTTALHRTLALAVALTVWGGMAPEVRAQPPQPAASGAPEAVLAFTAMTAGPYRMVSTVRDDLEAMLGAALAPGTLASGVGAVRKGNWVVFDAGEGLDSKAVQAMLSAGKLSLAGQGTRVATLRKGTATLFGDPHAGFPEAVAEVVGGDRFSAEASVWRLSDPEGRNLRLFGYGDEAAATAALREASGWGWSSAVHARVRAGGMVVALGAAEGGFAVHDMARRLDRRGALWVDAGNLIEDSNDARGRFTLQRTLSSLATGEVDALVPYKNELRLSHADQVRLAGTVPLVAANLIPPKDVRLVPFVIRQVAGARVAIVGVADAVTLTRNNLVGRKTGWTVRSEAEALRSAISEAGKQGAEAVVILTNKPAAEHAALQRVAGDSAAILGFDFDPGPPNRTASVTSDRALDRPWLSEAVSPFEIGQLGLSFRKAGASSLRRLERVSFDVLRPTERDLADPAVARRTVEAMSDFDASLADELLPDSRTLSRERPAYQSEEWTMLAAAAMRRAAGADAAVISVRRGGRSYRGAVPRSVVEDWLPSGTLVAKADVRGAALRKWVASLGPSVGLAGYDPVSGKIGGRPLHDDEVYRIVTTESFAFNEAFAGTFSAATSDFRLTGAALAEGGDGVTVAEVVLARLAAMKGQEGGFTPAFYQDLEALLSDTGKAMDPKWTVSLNPVDISFNGSTPYNTSAFSGVANSRVTAPDTQTLKTKGTAAVSFESSALTWETSGTLKYDAATITQSSSQQYRQLTNELRFGSQLFATAAGLDLPLLNARLVPFGELAYVTEVVPGINSKTGAENPRRQDTLGTFGLAYKGNGWLRELRAGFEARRNFALPNRAVEPGAQFALSLGQKVAGVDLSLESLVDSFLPAAGDSAADLGLSGQFATAARIPIGGGFGLRIGVDGLVFRGKVPATDTLGAVITPSIGLSYGATWKPLTGVLY